MNEQNENHETPKNLSEDPRLTAFALGELPADEHAASIPRTISVTGEGTATVLVSRYSSNPSIPISRPIPLSL